MFKENENSSVKAESADVQNVNQISKMNPFPFTKNAGKRMSTGSNNSDSLENYPVRENSEEGKIMFKEDENCSTDTEATIAQLGNQNNGNEAVGDLPATSAQSLSIVDEKIENSRMRENSINEASAKEKKLYDNINNIVKKCTANTKKQFVKMWYQVGEKINGFYKKGYDKNEMKGISDNTGISISSLYKATQFANTFTKDDHNRLLEKDFISFRLIVESFPLGRIRALEVFESSSTAKEAQGNINEFKRRESAKGINPDAGADSKSTDNEIAQDNGLAADKDPEKTDNESQPAGQVSAPTESQSQDRQAEVDQKQGSQDGQGAPVAEQPPSAKKTSKEKHQDTETGINKEVAEPVLFGNEDSPQSFPYIFETINMIGTKLVNTSIEKPANGDLRKIIQDAMKELTNLLVMVPEATCAHSGATLSGGTEWESSCQYAALPV